MSDGNVKLLMFSDIEGCQASPGKQSSFLCSKEFYNEIATKLEADPNLQVAFLGDYFDQGMRVYKSITGMKMLLDKFTKERVHVILGNRDVNKLRFCYELLNRKLVKNSISKMTSKDITKLTHTSKMITKPDGTQEEVMMCPNFDQGWSAWDPYFYGIYKEEIIQPPNYKVEGRIESNSDVGLVKHILISSMGANKIEDGKLTGLYSFMPFDKISSSNDEDAITYLKAALGIDLMDKKRPDDALDLLDFFQKCKLAHVFDGTHGKVLLSHAGGFDPEAFFDQPYVDSFGVGMPEVIDPSDYHSTLENFRQKLSGDGNVIQTGGQPELQIIGKSIGQGNVHVESSREKSLNYSKQLKSKLKSNSRKPQNNTSVLESDPVSESVNAYNDLLQTVLNELKNDPSPNFTWRFVLLQALGLKPDSEDARYKSLIQSCSQDGCKGPNEPLSSDPIDTTTNTTKLAKILKDSGITHVSYGHKPVCFPVPLFYQRSTIPGVTFISNDTSNGNRKVSEIGENTAVGTSVTFNANGLVESKVEVITLAPVMQYEDMFGPFSSENPPPTYITESDKETTLNYKGHVLSFNNLFPKPPDAFKQLRYTESSAATASSAAGGKRRSRHRKQHKSKRGSKHGGGSKKTMHRRRHKHTKRGRKPRKY